MKSSANLIFFDFDGVLCDSMDECFLSSWMAYHRFGRQQEPATVSLAARQQFAQLRPFIRDGQDYLLIHDLVEQGIQISTQVEFDQQLQLAGKTRMQQFRDWFYRARNYLIDTDFAYWCQINKLFPGVTELLHQYAKHPGLYILSTKRPQYIREILKFARIPFSEEHVLYNGASSKMVIIQQVLADYPGTTAHFVDDQISHFLQNDDTRIIPYIPAWGYIKPQWLTSGFKVLQLEELPQLFSLLPVQP